MRTYTIPEVAELFGVQRQTVYNWTMQGIIERLPEGVDGVKKTVAFFDADIIDEMKALGFTAGYRKGKMHFQRARRNVQIRRKAEREQNNENI